MNAPASPIDPGQLPHVWRGRALAQAQERTVSTGHAALDAHLPGGGWPVAALVEVLQKEAQQHVWQLVGPALARMGPGSSPGRQGEAPIVLVDAPYRPFGPSLRAQGIPPEMLLCVDAGKPSARLWACEQALRCADVTAVLAWLPQARSEDLRRLHLCAQAGDKLLFAFRPLTCRDHASPARARLLVQGTQDLQVQILKRRGPPLLQPLVLPAQPQRLAALLAARKVRRDQAPVALPTIGSHVLDRTPAFAG